MTDTLAVLVARLERISVDPDGADLDQLMATLEERKSVLAQIEQVDTSELGPETRRSLLERIKAVRERDARLLAGLQTRRAEALRQLDQLMHARQGVRGYRPSGQRDSRGPERIA